MNQIQTKQCLNKFSGNNYYIIEVDGESLETIVLKNRPEIHKGLVPTLLNWIRNNDEREVVWSRVLPEDNEKTLLPILMCSEDIDFSCHVIMVLVSADQKFVYWEKFGLAESDPEPASEIGKNIDWFNEVPAMKFPIEEYRNVIQKFRKYLKINDQANAYK